MDVFIGSTEMDDHISRQAALKILAELPHEYRTAEQRARTGGIAACQYEIRMMPSADVVEVVRCKDCRWYKTNYMWNCTEVKICAKEAYEPIRNADDYCSFGERKYD